MGVAATSLTVDGVALPLDAAGQAVFSSSDSGPHHALASATDTSGNVRTASLVLAVTDPADSEPPVVAIESPEELEALTFLALGRPTAAREIEERGAEDRWHCLETFRHGGEARGLQRLQSWSCTQAALVRAPLRGPSLVVGILLARSGFGRGAEGSHKGTGR